MIDSWSIPRKYRSHFITAVLLALCLAIYWQAGSFSFVNLDDDILVTDNRHVLPGLTPESVSWAFSWKSGTDYFWYPLTWLSHLADVSLFGLDAGKHHLMSAAIHGLNAILLFMVLLRMTGAAWRSAFVAALFAVHPLHVEPVAWVADRKDLLSALFYMSTLLAYARYAERPAKGRYVAVVFLFGLALMSKPTVVTLPFALLLLDGWPLCRLAGLSAEDGGRFPKVSLKQALLEKIPLLLMAAGMAVVAIMKSAPPASFESISPGQRMAGASIAYVTYLWRMACPTSLAVLYSVTGVFREAALLTSLGSTILLVAVTLLALRNWRGSPSLAVGWLFFLGSLAPVIGIVQAGESPMADRFTYIPSIGIFLSAAWAIPESAFRRRILGKILVGAAIVLVLQFTLMARVQAGYWRDSGTLFDHAVAVTPDNPTAHNNLGIHLISQGKYEEGVSHLREAIRIQPYWRAHHNLAKELSREGAVDEALLHYRAALQINASAPETHNNLGALLARRGQFPAAIFHFREALRLKPGYAIARQNLDDALIDMQAGPHRPRPLP